MSRLTLVIVPFVLAGVVAQAMTPAQDCQSAKNKLAGKYGKCRQTAEAKFARSDDGGKRTTALQKCMTKFMDKWPPVEAKAAAQGSACPSVGDRLTIRKLLEATTDDVSSRLAGGPGAGCPADLAICSGDLAACLLACPAPGGAPLRTGQEQCWNVYGDVRPCAGTGHDGELRKGVARAYVDNGDGTITDAGTGLMWEKLSDDDSIHDKDNEYTWEGAFAVKAAALNSGGGFAGHTDWRVPNRFELETLMDVGTVSPAMSGVFDTGCAEGCTVTACSCTRSNHYWSSSTYQIDAAKAWRVNSSAGSTSGANKMEPSFVRAVRGGS